MFSLTISQAVLNQIKATIGVLPPECGGVLGTSEKGIISYYYFDAHGISTVNGYKPDVEGINAMLADQWMPKGILMVGIVHSHANGVNVPSCGDINYAVRILQALDTVDCFYLPIVTITEGIMEMTCFCVYQDKEQGYVCRKVDYQVV